MVLDLDKEFKVEANASNYTTRGVLSIKCSNEKWRPVAFISKSLSDTERNYEIWTDHKNLEYFMKTQKLNRRQVRWALYLSRFNFMLKHVPGSKMGKADSLSRRPDWEIGVEKNNENETLVKPE